MEINGEIGIPKIEMELFDFRHTFQTRNFVLHHDVVKKTEYGQALVKRLRDDPRVAALDGKMLSKGGSASRFDVDSLAAWVTWCVNFHGEKVANENLERWLSAEEVEVISTLWVLGIDPGQTIELSDGYSIQRILEMPDSDDKENFLQHKLGVFAHQNFPKCAITKKIKVKKISEDLDAPDFKFDEYFVSARKLHDIALVLNSLSGVICVPYYQTSYAPSTTPIGHFGGSGGGIPMYDVSTRTVSSIAAASGSMIDALFSSYELKSDGEKTRLQLILNRISQAKRRIQIEDKILDLGIALEMLLLDDNQKEQLVLQFRLRGSWLVGKSFQDRQEKWGLLEDIYSARSLVAHTGTLYPNKPEKLKKVREDFPKYEALAEEILQKIIIDGTPSWRDLVLGGEVQGSPASSESA